MRKRIFAYQDNNADAIPCSSGCRTKAEYQLKQTGNNLELVKVGEIDIQAQIESFEDSVSLSKMIERFSRGDDTALTRRKGFYGDVSGFSDNPAEVIGNTRKIVKTAEAAAKKAPEADPAPSDSAPAPSDPAPASSDPTPKGE